MKAKIEVDIDELNLILVSLTQHSEFVKNTIINLRKQGTEQFTQLNTEIKASDATTT